MSHVMLLLDTILLSSPPIRKHFVTLTCHHCHTIERFAAPRDVYVRLNVFCSCFFFIIVATFGNCSGLYNYLWFGTWLVRQKLVHFVEESRLLSPSWRIRLCSFCRRLSECEFLSYSCRRLYLHILQLGDMPQFLAI